MELKCFVGSFGKEFLETTFTCKKPRYQLDVWHIHLFSFQAKSAHVQVIDLWVLFVCRPFYLTEAQPEIGIQRICGRWLCYLANRFLHIIRKKENNKNRPHLLGVYGDDMIVPTFNPIATPLHKRHTISIKHLPNVMEKKKKLINQYQAIYIPPICICFPR